MLQLAVCMKSSNFMPGLGICPRRPVANLQEPGRLSGERFLTQRLCSMHGVELGAEFARSSNTVVHLIPKIIGKDLERKLPSTIPVSPLKSAPQDGRPSDRWLGCCTRRLWNEAQVDDLCAPSVQPEGSDIEKLFTEISGLVQCGTEFYEIGPEGHLDIEILIKVTCATPCSLSWWLSRESGNDRHASGDAVSN